MKILKMKFYWEILAKYEIDFGEIISNFYFMKIVREFWENCEYFQ